MSMNEAIAHPGLEMRGSTSQTSNRCAWGFYLLWLKLSFSFVGQKGWRPRVGGLLFASLDGDLAVCLKHKFSKRRFVWLIRVGDEVPCLNGFITTFWKLSWDFIKTKDVFRVFSESS